MQRYSIKRKRYYSLQPLDERFWKYVRKTPTCWLWTAGLNEHGYGKLRENYEDIKAHRVSWIIHNGPIPNGKFVLHKCDNPACVNPEHLWIGNQTDNMTDCAKKMRMNPWRGYKVTPKNVSEIRNIYKHGGLISNIARSFHLTAGHVWQIVHNNCWKHVK